MSYQGKMTAPGKLGGGPRSHADSKAFSRCCATESIPHHRRQVKGGIPIFTDDGRRRVCAGYLHADGTFSKQMKSSHVLTKPEAIAIQADVFALLERHGCHTIEVTLLESGKALKASLRTFAAHGLRLNRGYGLQVALPMSYWRDAADPQESLFGGDE